MKILKFILLLYTAQFSSLAFADIPTPYWNLVAVHSSKCLDVPGDSNTAGTQLQQYDCNGGNAQRFYLQPFHSGGALKYRIAKAYHQVSIIRENGSSNTSPVVLASNTTPGDSPQWVLSPASDGKYNFVNTESNKCLDISGSSNGAPAQVYSCSGGTNQQFYLEPVGGHVTVKAVHSGKCLDVEGSSTANGARLEQKTCSGAWTQQWKMLPFSVYSYFFINRSTGKVADLYQGLTNNGTAIQQYSYAWNYNQVWEPSPWNPYSTPSAIYPRLGNGQQPYTILFPPAGSTGIKVFDIEGASQSDGANLQLWQLLTNAATNQQFTISQ